MLRRVQSCAQVISLIDRAVSVRPCAAKAIFSLVFSAISSISCAMPRLFPWSALLMSGAGAFPVRRRFSFALELVVEVFGFRFGGRRGFFLTFCRGVCPACD